MVTDICIDNIVSIHKYVDYAFSLLKDFKPNTINHMSMVNAALRPSGKSYRDRMIAGEHNDNPSKEIDDLLASNNGYLIFQEDTIKFLTDICGFTGSAADTTRRAIGKKDKELLKQQLPKILEGYCSHSSQPRVKAEEEAKQFVQIVQDSSEYQFGYNHSTAYSMNGYECVWLRTYYTIEFIAAYLNRAENKDDTNYGVELARMNDIKIKPIQFGKSMDKYTIEKETNSIYKGIESIKYCNSKIAEELLELSKQKDYKTFIELLDDITAKTSINSRQLEILIGLNFFSDFGNNKYLLNIYNLYNGIKEKGKTILPSFRNCSVISKKNIDNYSTYGLSEYLVKKYSNKETQSQYREIDNIGLLSELCNKIENKSMNVVEQMKFEKEYLQYIEYINPKISDNYYVVIDFKTYKNSTQPYLIVRNISSGEELKTRIKRSNIYKSKPFGEFSILKIYGFIWDFKRKKVGDDWIITDEKEPILEEYEVIKNEE